jgi:hypothetical protein
VVFNILLSQSVYFLASQAGVLNNLFYLPVSHEHPSGDIQCFSSFAFLPTYMKSFLSAFLPTFLPRPLIQSGNIPPHHFQAEIGVAHTLVGG